MPLLSIKEAATELRVSRQWLKYWLAANPVDSAGVPFYVQMGSRTKFEQQDLQRILAHMRELEAARLGPSVKSKIRLLGLMQQVGGGDYETLVRMRQEAKTPPASSTKLLAELAVDAVMGPKRRLKPVQRRVRLPGRPKQPTES